MFFTYFVEYHNCTYDQFQCESGHCTSKTSVCDGRRDCQDASDEKNCKPRYPGGRYCPANKFQCKNNVSLRFVYHFLRKSLISAFTLECLV